MRYGLLLIIVILAAAFAAAGHAMTYNDETVRQGVTDFEWCWTPDWTDKDSYRTMWELYVDDNGCGITEKHLYAYVTTEYVEKECFTEQSCEMISTGLKDANGTSVKVQECTEKESCHDAVKQFVERKEVTKEDFLFTGAERLCYTAKRKATTSLKSCDMNFRLDENNDGIKEYDAVMDMKTWWNTTWFYEYELNVTLPASPPYFPFRLLLNDSVINFSHCQADGGDFRIVNSTKDGEVKFNLSYWNATAKSAIIIVNDTISANKTYYMYCNTTSVQTSTSVALQDSILPLLQYKCNSGYDNSGTLPGNRNLTLVGTPPGFNTTGQKVGSAACGFNTSSAAGLTNSSGMTTGNVNHTFSYWQFLDVVDVDYHVGVGNSQSNEQGSSMQHVSTDNITYLVQGASYPAATFRPNVGTWEYIMLKYYANRTSEFFVNGTLKGSYTQAAGATLNLAYGGAYDFCLNSRSGDCLAAVMGSGWYDDVRYYEASLPPSYNGAIYAGGSGTESLLSVFATPAVSIGSAKSGDSETTLTKGIYDANYANISLLDEGQEHFVWAAFNYTINKTSVSPNAYCNFSANRTISEYYYSNSTNISVCVSGCNESNYTRQFDGVETEGFERGIIRTRLCRVGTAVDSNYFITTNCSASSYSFSYSTLPLCSIGYVNVSIIDKNCSGVSSINLSVWSNAAAAAKRLRVVNSFLGYDVEHNHTGVLYYNSSLGTFVSNRTFEYYEHGYKNITINCYANISGVQNQTGSVLTVAVENVPPVLSFGTVWYWLLTDPVAFTELYAAGYPLFSTVNLSGFAFDDDLDTVKVYLNFSNGTNINTVTQTGSVVRQNYTQGNFSTNLSFIKGEAGYYWQLWANDSTSNVSSIQRLFYAANTLPKGFWVNASGGAYGEIPLVFNYSCTDAELQTRNASIWINDTYNVSILNGTNFTFNNGIGTWNLTMQCCDSFQCDQNRTLLFSYSPFCMVSIYGMCNGCRYQDNTINTSLNCTNGVIPQNCWYSINDYAPVLIENCSSSFTILAENGMNDMTLTVESSSVNGTEQLYFWAKDYDSDSFSDYSVMFVMLIVSFVMLLFGVLFHPLFHIAGSVAWFVTSYAVIAFSIPLAMLIGIAGVVTAIAAVFQRPKM